MRIRDPESFWPWIRDGKISNPRWKNFESGINSRIRNTGDKRSHCFCRERRAKDFSYVTTHLGSYGKQGRKENLTGPLPESASKCFILPVLYYICTWKRLSAFLLMTRSACGSSWLLSCSRLSRALRARRWRAAESRTRRASWSLMRADILNFVSSFTQLSRCSGFFIAL